MAVLRREATILVVDDDVDLRRLLVIGLQRRGYATAEAGDGEEALRVVSDVEVDLVLLDSGLPKLDGMEVLQRLRAMSTMATLPVIMVTGRNELADRISGLGAGANDYLAKPVSLDELTARIESNLRGQRLWVAKLTDRLHERTQLAVQIAARPPSGDVHRHVVDTIASLQSVASASIVEVSISGVARATTVSGQARKSTIANLIDQLSIDDLNQLLTDGAAVLTRYASGSSDGSSAGRLVSATVGLRGSTTIALVIEVDPSLPDQRRLVREMLGLAVELAPMVENLLEPSQSTEALADLAASLELVIEKGNHRPVFQPIRNIENGRIMGYEALTRFDDGVAPDVRFGEARFAGVGARLELATLRSAITASHGLPDGQYLSINVSATLLGHADLPAILDLAADRQLTIEITEHEQIHDYDHVRKEFAELGRGLHMAVDDAGSGWASLRHVFSLRPHYVKLDRSWIADVHTDPARQALLLGIARSVNEMGGHVIAEGIELQEELEAVKSIGIQLGQGYLLGRPTVVTDLPSD